LENSALFVKVRPRADRCDAPASFLFVLVVGLVVATTAQAEAGASQATGNAPKVDLGRLLKLPDSYAKPTESRRGMGRSEWEVRFESVRLELAESQAALEAAQTELGNAAGDSSQWSVAAPGTSPNPENTPLSYKLRQEIRRNREIIERSEKKLRSLEIEADLAEVPANWRATHIRTDAKELSVGDAKTTVR
jgi:hypothetical protein